jgi:hypothetical protein
MNIYKKICSCGVSKEKGFEWLLRISVFMTFVGHGAYGFVHKPGWLPFYEVLGIGPEMAQNLFPLTGIMDVTMGILALVLPIRAPFLFLAFWGTFTAFLRPLAMDLPSALKGQYSWFEVLERAGNYVPAFVAVYLMGIRSKPGIKGFIVGIFEKVPVPTFTIKTANVASWMLRIGTFLLLIGHAGYGAVVHKTMLVKHYASIGLTTSFADPMVLVTYIGYFEILLALLVLIWPRNSLLWFVVVWKVATEFLYVTAGVPWTLFGVTLQYYDIFEWIERGGSYLAPLMLIYLNQMKSDSTEDTKTSSDKDLSKP